MINFQKITINVVVGVCLSLLATGLSNIVPDMEPFWFFATGVIAGVFIASNSD